MSMNSLHTRHMNIIMRIPSVNVKFNNYKQMKVAWKNLTQKDMI